VQPSVDHVVARHVVSFAGQRHPEWIDALAAASLTGINRHEVNKILPIQSGQRTSSDRPSVLESLRRLSG
jgi:hypothetical protein